MRPATPFASLPPVVTFVAGRALERVVFWLALAFLVGGASGCLSNEYRISRDELRRLAETPPEARGEGVRVSQKLGDRRSDALEPPSPALTQPPSPVETVVDDPAYDDAADVDVNLNVSAGGGGRGPTGSTAWRGAAPVRPVPHVDVATGGFHGAPPPRGGGGGGGWHMPGLDLGGGGGGKDGAAAVLVVVAVVAVVAATAATIGLAASEGMRYEGHAALSPEQLVHLKRGDDEQVVALADLSPAQAASADEALVMDDEGFGMRRLDHAPLDRKGAVFRFDLGGGMFTFGDARASGFSAHIQTGYYPTHTVGIVADLGLGVGTLDPCCVGGLAASGSIARHSLGLELQALPLGLGPLHLGGFAGGGVAVASTGGAYETGPMASGGALLEVDLTSHMALAMRGGVNAAWLPDGRSTAGTFTGGLAIY
jgi:hypothetical protein